MAGSEGFESPGVRGRASGLYSHVFKGSKQFMDP